MAEYDPHAVGPTGETPVTIALSFVFGLGLLGLATWALVSGRVTDLEGDWFYRSRAAGEYWTLTLLFLVAGLFLTAKGVRDATRSRSRRAPFR